MSVAYGGAKKRRSTPSGSTASSSCRKRGIRLFRSRRDRKVLAGLGPSRQEDAGALGFLLGMSIAVGVAQVMKRKCSTPMMDQLSQVCAAAVRESLLNVYGDKFDGFVADFEKSFRSTLMTSRLVNKLVNKSVQDNPPEMRKCFSEDSGTKQCWSDPLLVSSNSGQSRHGEESLRRNNNQLVLHDGRMDKNCNEFSNQPIILSTLEKSVTEQVRCNDLKTFEMGLRMKKLELKERQLALSEKANLMERWKLSFGFSKACFKVEKFKTQLEETRHAQLLRKCTDYLVAGLLVKLSCVAYSVYIYSHRRISEATMSCAEELESRSWWLPEPMASLHSGWLALKCQFQIWIRMLAGGIMIVAVAFLLLQRSSSGSAQAMPVTFIGLLLAVGCGFVGSLCIETLGGDGSCWLLFWETLCCLHLFANIWTSALFRLLHGSLQVSGEIIKPRPLIPYLMRRCLFFTTVCFFLPLLCGFLPFAGLGEWKDHFFSLMLESSQLYTQH